MWINAGDATHSELLIKNYAQYLKELDLNVLHTAAENGNEKILTFEQY